MEEDDSLRAMFPWISAGSPLPELTPLLLVLPGNAGVERDVTTPTVATGPTDPDGMMLVGIERVVSGDCV